VSVADIAFDAPIDHPFSYRVPDAWTPVVGQRVLAPLGRARRTGVVVAVRDADGAGLKPLLAPVDATPVVDGGALDLARWIGEQSLSSLGSTLAALLPPPLERAAGRTAGATPRAPVDRATPALLVGAGRESRLLDRIGAGPALVIVPDIDAAARWAGRLAKRGRVVRLDSGVDDVERTSAWTALREGVAPLAVGTRSALLAPMPHGGAVALVDEHETAHKPPGPPRLHSRDVVLERAARDPLRALLTSATPSVEMWWRADSGRAGLEASPPGPWPTAHVADTRGILRREPLTPTLARAVRETLAAGRRVLLVVSRLTSALACDECGGVVRCPACLVAFAYARAARTLGCRVCGRTEPIPDTCPTCRGRRLSPFGWGPERVEHAVRRRFPQARVARYDPDAARGARLLAQRRAATDAQVVIGTRGALRLFGPGALGLAGFVSPDQLLRLPDFRAGERLFGLVWAAAERVERGGALILQSQSPEHYAIDAAMRHDLAAFYRHELKFRGELGYPPFRRLAVITVTARDAPDLRDRADAIAAALRADRELTVYPPVADRRDRARRIVVKGRDDLARRLRSALADLRRPTPKTRSATDVEMDPVEWPL
jgi:primosomal protein N' (replication factor Y)